MSSITPAPVSKTGNTKPPELTNTQKATCHGPLILETGLSFNLTTRSMERYQFTVSRRPPMPTPLDLLLDDALEELDEHHKRTDMNAILDGALDEFDEHRRRTDLNAILDDALDTFDGGKAFSKPKGLIKTKIHRYPAAGIALATASLPWSTSNASPEPKGLIKTKIHRYPTAGIALATASLPWSTSNASPEPKGLIKTKVHRYPAAGIALATASLPWS